MISLAEALPVEQERCRTILEHALEIGPAGDFLAASLRADLKKAEVAAAAGDTVEMVRAYQALKDYKE